MNYELLMKKEKILYVLISIIGVNIIIYFLIKQIYLEPSLEFRTIKMITILVINIVLILLMFLIDIELFKKMTLYAVVIGMIIYGYYILAQYNDWLPFIWNEWEMITILIYAIIAPGLILYILHYIKHGSSKYVDKKYGKYHVHESFIGTVLLAVAVILILLILILYQNIVIIKDFYFVIAILGLLLFYFLYLGSFLIFRDWKDFKSFKFIEKPKRSEKKIVIPLFNEIDEEDLHFFEFPKHKLYSLGIVLTSISLSTIIYSNGLFPREFFFLDREIIIIFGFVCCFIAGGMLGKDWFRLFRKFEPELYKEIEKGLDKLKKI